jgi:hypothetical protein
VLTCTPGCFETDLLTTRDNLIGPLALTRRTLGQPESFYKPDRILLEDTKHGDFELQGWPECQRR